MTRTRLFISLLLAVNLGGVSATLQAQGTTGGTTLTTTTAGTPATPARASQPENRLVNEFSTFAGSRENATALVQGLRSGSGVTLQTAATTPGGTPTTTSFTPPTRPMGYGNTRIALSLARAQLASQGIDNPTGEQLQGALMGTPASGTQPATQGILQMRAAGMGWGKIANTMGYKLGAVMSGKTPKAEHGVQTVGRSRVTTANGGHAGDGDGNGKGRGTVSAGGNAGGGASPKSKGIVSAAGSSVPASAGALHGAKAQGGVVSAAGGQGVGNAGGSHGKGGKN